MYAPLHLQVLVWRLDTDAGEAADQPGRLIHRLPHNAAVRGGLLQPACSLADHKPHNRPSISMQEVSSPFDTVSFCVQVEALAWEAESSQLAVSDGASVSVW